MYEMLPTYVGSKKSWVSKLEKFRGDDFVELFCGSGVLAFNLASKAAFNDADEFVHKIVSRFDELIVPDVFTEEQYFQVRSQTDWWRYAFCLQAMSFSGVFRHSKNGYNVPIKKNLKAVRMRERYETSLKRWRELKPETTNLPYHGIPLTKLAGKIAVFDPPYFGSQASYNNDRNWKSGLYWNYLLAATQVAKAVILFDRADNLRLARIPAYDSRTMRVNGKHAANEEQLAIYEEGAWQLPKEESEPLRLRIEANSRKKV